MKCLRFDHYKGIMASLLTPQKSPNKLKAIIYTFKIFLLLALEIYKENRAHSLKLELVKGKFSSDSFSYQRNFLLPFVRL